MLAAERPVVAVIGDSTSTLRPSAISPSDTLYYALTRRLREDNPGKRFVFHNRSIGSTGLNQWNTSAKANHPPWYFNPALPALPYVQALNVTTLFINLGINDAEAFSAAALRVLLGRVVDWGQPLPARQASKVYQTGDLVADAAGRPQICAAAGVSGPAPPAWQTQAGHTTADGAAAWQLLAPEPFRPQVPDIVLLTNKTPNRAAEAPSSTPLRQHGALAAASYVRTLALSGGAGLDLPGLPPLGLIDTGRYFAMVHLGFDPAIQSFAATGFKQRVAALPFTLPPSPGGDFDLQFVVGRGPMFEPAAETSIQVTTGGPGAAAPTSVVFSPRSPDLGIMIDDAAGPRPQNAPVIHEGVWRAEGNVLRVTAKGGHLLVQANGSILLECLTARFVCPGFCPVISVTAASPSTPPITIVVYNVGTPMPCRATLTSEDLVYGQMGGPRGGNGINHQASPGINGADLPVLEATRFGP